MGEISFFEWFVLGMPWELIVIGLVLVVAAALVGGVANLVRRIFRRG